MTLPSSGIMTAAMINAEMQRPAGTPLSFNDSEVRRLAEKPSGLITMADFYGKTFEYVVVTTQNYDRISVQAFFTTAQWASSVPKRLINNHVLFSSAAATPALTSGTGRGGTLIVENRGSILGGPGAPNGGWGGDAFRTDQAGVTIENYGNIFGGGGAGGRGGNGGGGYYYTPYTAQEGPVFDFNTHYVEPIGGEVYNYYWNGVFVGQAFPGSPAPSDGTYTYYAGSYQSASNKYAIYRTYTAYNTTYTSGGSGGNGGWGTGWTGGGSSAGQAGGAGGINAGNGGAGGAGGGWGLSGAAGNAGGSGNNGGGAAGSAGGLAGRAIFNSVGTATLQAFAGSDVRGR